MVSRTYCSHNNGPRNEWQTTPGISVTLKWIVGSAPAYHSFKEILSIKETLSPKTTIKEKHKKISHFIKKLLTIKFNVIPCSLTFF